MRHIEDKQEFYRLSRAGLLGNILRQWEYAEFASHRAPGIAGVLWDEVIPEIVGVRHVSKAFTSKGVSSLMLREEAYQYATRCIQEGESSSNLLFDEGALHDHITIQGEVMPCERHLYVRYSYLQCHQRVLWRIDVNGSAGLAAAHQMPCNTVRGPAVRHATGLHASNLLRFYMDGPSWDKLNEIFEEYHFPVVEFACFDRSIGVLGWNTLFWEVRTKY